MPNCHLGVECNVGSDDDVVNAGNGNDISIKSEEIPDPEESDGMMVLLRM